MAEEGGVKIDICFAHHDTLNFTSKWVTFTIDRANKKPTLPPSSVPVLRQVLGPPMRFTSEMLTSPAERRNVRKQRGVQPETHDKA